MNIEVEIMTRNDAVKFLGFLRYYEFNTNTTQPSPKKKKVHITLLDVELGVFVRRGINIYQGSGGSTPDLNFFGGYIVIWIFIVLKIVWLFTHFTYSRLKNKHK